MNENLNILDVVALTENVAERGLVRGQVGTIVETLGGDVFEVEFSDGEGRTYATAALRAGQLMALHHEPLGDQHSAA